MDKPQVIGMMAGGSLALLALLVTTAWLNFLGALEKLDEVSGDGTYLD